MLVGSSIPKMLKGCSGGPHKSNRVYKRTVMQEEKKGKARRKGNFRIHEKKHDKLSSEGPQTRGVRKSNVHGTPKLRGQENKIYRGGTRGTEN